MPFTKTISFASSYPGILAASTSWMVSVLLADFSRNSLLKMLPILVYFHSSCLEVGTPSLLNVSNAFCSCNRNLPLPDACTEWNRSLILSIVFIEYFYELGLLCCIYFTLDEVVSSLFKFKCEFLWS